jgi:hypothetical protein
MYQALIFKTISSCIVLFSFLLASLPLHAQNSPPLAPEINHPKGAPPPAKKRNLDWDHLNPNEQGVLETLQPDWNGMSQDSKKKWLRLAHHYPRMKPAEQGLLKNRMADWAKLSQQDRRIARDNYLSSLPISSKKKAEAWRAYQQLPEEEKQKLAAQQAQQRKLSAATSPNLQQPRNNFNPASNSNNAEPSQ